MVLSTVLSGLQNLVKQPLYTNLISIANLPKIQYLICLLRSINIDRFSDEITFHQ